MKILLAQLNPIVGDLAGNFAKVKAAISKNGNTHDLIVFPELTLTGYPPNDLLLRKGFVDEQLYYLSEVQKLSVDIKATILIGAVTRNTSVGKPLRNTALAFQNGRAEMTYYKQLLPTYNIFDECRYFEAGNDKQSNLVMIGDKAIRVLICEDCWNDEAICDAPLYPTNPVAVSCNGTNRAKADVIVTLNASPSDIGKHLVRYKMYQTLSKKYGVPFIYVNQVGGQDSLIFDGHSFVANGEHLYQAVGFQEQEYSYNLTPDLWPPNLVHTAKFKENELIYEHLKLGIKDYMSKNGFKRAVIGSSGGIDSAVVLALAKESIGAENVAAITMPAQYSSNGSVDDSVTLCKNLNIKLYNRPIDVDTANGITFFEQTFGEMPKRLTIENIQPRIRMQVLMAYSNQYGALVLNTTNKSEASVGYGTIFGDCAGGLAVLGDLYKMEVYAFAKWYNDWRQENVIPKAIIDKAPSAELWENQRDTDSLPPYPVLDALLKLYLERDLLTREEIASNKLLIRDMNLKEIERVLKLVDGAEYKRRMAPPCIRVHRRAFGFGRNLPITQKHPVTFENVI